MFPHKKLWADGDYLLALLPASAFDYSKEVHNPSLQDISPLHDIITKLGPQVHEPLVASRLSERE